MKVSIIESLYNLPLSEADVEESPESLLLPPVPLVKVCNVCSASLDTSDAADAVDVAEPGLLELKRDWGRDWGREPLPLLVMALVALVGDLFPTASMLCLISSSTSTPTPIPILRLSRLSSPRLSSLLARPRRRAIETTSPFLSLSLSMSMSMSIAFFFTIPRAARLSLPNVLFFPPSIELDAAADSDPCISISISIGININMYVRE